MKLEAIWRHPIKGIGTEALESAVLRPNGGIYGDRVWALQEGEAALDSEAWAKPGYFVRGAKAPALMAVRCETLASSELRLSHPELPDIQLNPESADAIAQWIAPIWPKERKLPGKICKASQPMTDVQHGLISLMSLSSLNALSEIAGIALDMRRFRGNLWVDDLEGAWKEFSLADRKIAIGNQVLLEIMEPINRCRAIQGNPETGEEDIQLIDLMHDKLGHKQFGVLARVIHGGTIEPGMTVRLNA